MDKNETIQEAHVTPGVSDLLGGAAIVGSVVLFTGLKNAWTEPALVMSVVTGIIFLWSSIGALAISIRFGRITTPHALPYQEAMKFVNPILCPSMIGCLFAIAAALIRPGPAPHSELFWAFIIVLGLASFLLFGAGMCIHDWLLKTQLEPKTVVEPEKAP